MTGRKRSGDVRLGQGAGAPEAGAPKAGAGAVPKEMNMQFCILSVLGMIFVVDGHMNNSYLDIGGLVPYYSFHMPLFAFISGYFYRKGSENQPAAYARKKAARLLGPYMVYNLVYGILAWFLHGAGFAFGGGLNLHNLLIEPFVTGHQFEYNLASWFVPALFLVEMANVCLRRVLRRISPKMGSDEYVIGLVCLGVGMGGILLSLSGRYQGPWLTLVRMMFLLPCYEGGTLYREKLEARDGAGNMLYFGLILTAELALVLSGRPLIYSVAFCNGFDGIFLPYITAGLGIAFWLRISRIGAAALKDSPGIRYFGGHTYGVMMHHIMALMVMKTFFAFFAKYTSLFAGFSFEQYKTDLWYLYYPKGLPQFRVFYLAGAIMLPLLFQRILERALERV